MKILWTEPALEDLRNLHAYIAKDSEIYVTEILAYLNKHRGKWID